MDVLFMFPALENWHKHCSIIVRMLHRTSEPEPRTSCQLLCCRLNIFTDSTPVWGFEPTQCEQQTDTYICTLWNPFTCYPAEDMTHLVIVCAELSPYNSEGSHLSSYDAVLCQSQEEQHELRPHWSASSSCLARGLNRLELNSLLSKMFF